MHVCFLVHREYPQNYSTAINEYTTNLVQQGVDVTVIAGRTSSETPRHEVLSGVNVHRIDTDVSTSVSIEPSRFAYRGLKRLDQICQKRQVDVLHFLGFPNLGGVLRPVPWLRSPPATVMDVRGTAVRNVVFDAISRVALRVQQHLVDRTVVVDEQVAVNVLGTDHTASILPLGVDFERFQPGHNDDLREQWGYSDNTVVGYTGSLHTPRRLTRAIEVFHQLVTLHPDVRLVIVGDGNDRRSLMKEVEHRGLSDRVEFTGEVAFSEVPNYLNAFDIGFSYIPDRPQYRDQPPLKTAEFLAAGLPVLGTDTPGNRVFITHDHNGHLVDDEIDAYVEGLSALLTMDERRKKLADSGRESIREYSYRSIVRSRLIPLYRELVAESR
jgi:glycosyltransferase involved in cell wall biosynthesis